MKLNVSVVVAFALVSIIILGAVTGFAIKFKVGTMKKAADYQLSKKVDLSKLTLTKLRPGAQPSIPASHQISFCYDPDALDMFPNFRKTTVQTTGKEYTDECISSTTDMLMLKEYTCKGKVLDNQIISCALGCSDGACLKCVDSDGGINLNQVGTCKQINPSNSFVDDCSGSQATEYSCSAPNGFCVQSIQSCQSGTECKSGACGVCLPGEKKCEGNTAITCEVDGMGWEVSQQCPFACNKGICVDCIDSDNTGILFRPEENISSLYVQGTVTCSDGESKTDYCTSEYKLMEYEYYHNYSNNSIGIEVWCPAGCFSGACNHGAECVDLDSDVQNPQGNPYIRGITMRFGLGASNVGASMDSCFNTGAGNLDELYCSSPIDRGGMIRHVNCQNGCYEGACNP